MSSSEELESLLRAPKSNTGFELKSALTRLSAEVRERADRGSVTSVEFFVTTLNAISRIRGAAHADLRFDCLLNCGLYFYRT